LTASEFSGDVLIVTCAVFTGAGWFCSFSADTCISWSVQTFFGQFCNVLDRFSLVFSWFGDISANLICVLSGLVIFQPVLMVFQPIFFFFFFLIFINNNLIERKEQSPRT
jgi:hypothetical protein